MPFAKWLGSLSMSTQVAIGEKDQEIAMLTSHMKELEEKDSKHAAMIAQMEKDIEVACFLCSTATLSPSFPFLHVLCLQRTSFTQQMTCQSHLWLLSSSSSSHCIHFLLFSISTSFIFCPSLVWLDFDFIPLYLTAYVLFCLCTWMVECESEEHPSIHDRIPRRWKELRHSSRQQRR